MAKIVRIKIECTRQEDWTGSDDLDFYIDDQYLGRVTIASGQSREVDGSNGLYDASWIESGQTIKVYEDDFDWDDLVLEYRPSDDEIRQGFTTSNTAGDCNYTFEFEFIDI
jgi:hypothetical protein